MHADLNVDWSDDFGDRAFCYDAFLSHNRGDFSTDLAEALRSVGAFVWHDANADMRDRQVIPTISIALIRSRYIVVCLDQGSLSSGWTKAEYKLALDLQKRTGVVRVLVATPTPNNLIPQELAHCLQFSNPRELGTFIREGNKIGFLPTLIAAGGSAANGEEESRLRASVRPEHTFDYFTQSEEYFLILPHDQNTCWTKRARTNSPIPSTYFETSLMIIMMPYRQEIVRRAHFFDRYAWCVAVPQISIIGQMR